MDISVNALFKIKEEFFEKYNSKYFMDNKNGSRPYFYVFKSNDDILWVIPLSSQVDKYRLKIEKDEQKHKQCLFYHIAKIESKESVFLIGDMFPITSNYIKDNFYVNGEKYFVENKEAIKKIHKKAKMYLTMVRYKKLKPYVNILNIEKELLKEMGTDNV